MLIALYLFADSGSAQWSIALSWCVKAAMLVLAVRGLYRSIVKDGAKKKTVPWQPMAKRVSAWILFTVVLSVPAAVVCWDTIPFLGNGWLSSLLSFGGGDAYLTVASGIFVDTGAVDSSDFYGHLAPIVNAMPGSILCKVLSGVGYYIGYDATGGMTGGYLVALAGFSCSLAASGSVFCIVYYIYECFEKLDVFRLISRWIRPIIAGLLLSLILSLVYQNTQTAVKLESSVPVILGITVFIYAIDQLLLYKWKKKNGILILFSGIASLLLCNLAIYFQAV
ncbi:MAG: chromate transporter [Clostridiaceae bacterium]|nr:chromate transporter [Clostridiaceae bacterium]